MKIKKSRIIPFFQNDTVWPICLQLHPCRGVAPHLVEPLLQLPGGLLHPTLPPDVHLLAEPILHHRLVLLRDDLWSLVLGLEAHIAEQLAAPLLPPEPEGEGRHVLLLLLGPGQVGPAEPGEEGGGGGEERGGADTGRHLKIKIKSNITTETTLFRDQQTESHAGLRENIPSIEEM